MKLFSERNVYTIGAAGIALTVALLIGALNYSKLPFFNDKRTYAAYFAESGGLTPGSAVWVRGSQVGQVKSVRLDDDKVLITFDAKDGIRLGDRSEAAVKTKSLLGAKVLEVTPRGGASQTGPIPIERTTPAYMLPDALGDVSTAISGLDTNQLSQSLSVLAKTFQDTPPELRVAVQGATRFSEVLNQHDADLRTLLANARKVTSVLADRADEVVGLIRDTNALLAELNMQRAALDQLSGNISTASRQLVGFIDDNRATLKPALDKLNGVLTIVDNRKTNVQSAIKKLNLYAMSLGESLSSGPFFKAYISNLLPGQFLQPFIDAAFSDLGLDPATLLPSQRTDPQVGQPGTPPLPLPYPRTGQGGPPRQNLPDAITGNPGDQPCSVPGRPGAPGCYPYRQPPPPPPPGGPPPGPPLPPVGSNTIPTPTPTHVLVPAPNEAPPAGQGGRR
jgi:phospholipid/cholesterol/gamma-HCH transport system substrate-binding protein